MSPDAIPYLDYLASNRPGIRERAIIQFLTVIERSLGITCVIESKRLSASDIGLGDLPITAERLKKAGTIASYARVLQLPDEPRMFHWSVDHGSRIRAGGLSVVSDYDALIASLAESVERKIWSDETDYFHNATESTVDELGEKAAIRPERFVAFNDTQRAHPSLSLTPSQRYVWVEGYSWTKRAPVYMPAQTISSKAAHQNAHKEPRIRPVITTGLATGQTREDALLGGALEIIERDAFMIMWLNQLSLPQISHDALGERESLTRLLAECATYRLNVVFVRLITDAPAHAVCAVVSDTAHMPPVAVGLSAHSNLARAAEKALLEALRARLNIRHRRAKEPHFDTARDKLVHIERARYWAEGDRYRNLSFLTAGEARTIEHEPWNDTKTAEHLALIIAWCAESGYELASVEMTHSKANPMPWHVHHVVMPDLQPLHQDERLQALGGDRLVSVPKRFGYMPRATPFLDEPHPFI